MDYILEICKKANRAKLELKKLNTYEKNKILLNISNNILKYKDNILEENKKDVSNAIENGLKGAYVKRLILDEEKVLGLAQTLKDIVVLKDPIGEFESNVTMENGLIIGKKRVALGVIGVIYESRPNVTLEVFALCFKASSVSILKGGKEAILSNTIIHKIITDTILEMGYNKDFCQLITDNNRECTNFLIKQREYIDLLIPRGGSGLINFISENSIIPVIETGVGNCHIYIDESCNIKKAIDIIINGKVQRPDVCNSIENLIIHENIAEEILPIIKFELERNNVEIRGSKEVRNIIECIPATEEDFKTEYLDLIISIKIVKSFDEAINHIEKYSTRHSDVIVSENYSNIQRFLNEVDSAVVYANASSRFTDGGQFGFGGEIGISTQKLHARGPMGLKEITTTKYIVYGSGQIRE